MAAAHAPAVLLKTIDDWFYWYDMLRGRAIRHSIWEYIDPDGDDDTVLQRPTVPTRQGRLEAINAQPREQRTSGSNPVQLQQTLTPRQTEEENVMMEIDVFKFKIELDRYKEQNEALIGIADWIEQTVKREYLQTVDLSRGVRVLIRQLRRRVTGTLSSYHLHIWDKYFRQLEQATECRHDIESWYNKWVALRREAEHLGLSFVCGSSIKSDQFLDAVKPICPGWVSRMQIISHRPDMTLERLGELFINETTKHGGIAVSENVSGTSSTVGPRQDRRLQGDRTTYECACGPKRHAFKPEDCNALHKVLTGKVWTHTQKGLQEGATRRARAALEHNPKWAPLKQRILEKARERDGQPHVKREWESVL